MRLDKSEGGIQVDGVSFLNHIALVFSIVIKGLVVAYKLLQGLVCTAALQPLKLFQIEGLYYLVNLIDRSFKGKRVEILEGL